MSRAACKVAVDEMLSQLGTLPATAKNGESPVNARERILRDCSLRLTNDIAVRYGGTDKEREQVRTFYKIFCEPFGTATERELDWLEDFNKSFAFDL